MTLTVLLINRNFWIRFVKHRFGRNTNGKDRSAETDRMIDVANERLLTKNSVLELDNVLQ